MEAVVDSEPCICTSIHVSVCPRSHWSGSRPGFCYTIDAGPSWELLLVILGCGDPSALGLQDPFLHVLWQITDGEDVGMDQHITLDLGLGSCRVGQSASSPLFSPPGRALLR